MTRLICIVSGIVLTLVPFRSVQIGLDADPNHLGLVTALGGNPNNTPKTYWCDGGPSKLAGRVYVGCSGVGASCRQCATQNPDGSVTGTTFQGLVTSGVYQTLGYDYQHAPPFQDCGTVLTGKCVVNPKPGPGQTNFTCLGTFGNTNCTIYEEIVAQVPPVPNPGGPK